MSELTSYYYYEDRVITPATHQYRVYHADEADKVIAEKDTEIAELKQKLEDVQASAYAESVDAGMRERRLKRALYKACANWAHFAVAFFSSYATKERWHNMENKCIKKAEEYK